MSQSLLSLSKVSKTFGAVTALGSISVEVFPGEIVALLGANGAGKTTFVNLIAGLQVPTTGHISVFGLCPTDSVVKARRRILPQELGFPIHLTVREVLDVVYSHYDTGEYLEFSAQVGLDHFFDRAVGVLSGGERRKLAFLCALAGNPSLVVMDEPTANIDLIGQQAVFSILKKKFSNKDSALVFSSHQMSEVEALATRAIVLRRGSVVFDGAVSKIRDICSVKKVRFFSKKPLTKMKTASALNSLGNNVFEAVGLDSDAMLRELIGETQFDSSRFEILEPTLEEAILNLWQARGNL